MKTLKFEPKLIPLVLNGSKTNTWRINDDKDLQEGDELEFLNSQTKEVFTKAVLIKVKETTLGVLSDEDWQGHERYSSNEEMYETYSKYYNCNVDENTKLKIIDFKLLQN